MKRYYLLLSLCFLILPLILSAQSNTSLGVNAGNAGGNNSAFGRDAGDLVTGYSNSFIGYLAGKYTTSGGYNLMIGSHAGSLTTTGGYNSYIGYAAGYKATTANYNTCIGVYSGYETTTGSYNVFLGMYSGKFHTTGINNVYLGYQSGYTGNGSNNVFLGSYAGRNESGSNKLYIENTTSSTPLIYGEFDNNIVAINGNLGVGATSFDDAQLVVDGKLSAKKIIITTNDFPDYVFEEDYQLLALNDLETYIKTNKHLPGITPQEEVLKAGLPIGEFNKQLLEKIEELTLYVISLDKKRALLKEQNSEIQKVFENLQASNSLDQTKSR